MTHHRYLCDCDSCTTLRTVDKWLYGVVLIAAVAVGLALKWVLPQ